MKNLIISLLLIICTSTFTFAATFVVNNNGDTNDANTSDNICADSSGNCTLRAAIQQANASPGDDTITFALVTPATITLANGELRIDSNITIDGLGARNLIIDGNNASGVLSIGGFGGTFIIVRISGLTVTNGNSGGRTGGGILNYGTLNLSDVTIRNNVSLNSGGGIRNSGTLNLSDVTIRNNVSSISGGGISNTGTLNINRSTINNNTSASSNFSGGGIANFNSANISNTTISNNSAGRGGGISNSLEVQSASPRMTLNNVTISNNTAFSRGGGISNEGVGSIAIVRNTIIAQNNGFFDDINVLFRSSDIDGSFNSLGNNFIGNGTNGSGFINGVNGDKVGTSANPIDPLLGALQNNGGQTDTRALLAGSPAIDMGNNCVFTATCLSNNPIQPLTTDQRGIGFSRFIGSAVDIGAFEVQSPPTPTPTPTPIPTPTPTPTPTPQTCTPSTTVSEGDLFAGGIASFGVSSGAGSVTVDHVNAGTGLQSLTVVGTPINAVVNIPAFTPGTFAPIVVTFTTPNPTLPTDFTLRAASTFHAAFIRVRCSP
ncbi:MAG: hypothetical protein M3367_15570 [Acidobacteriota bacterium]|nr:hypothetical protein [Acidobacteriota bacterium]